MAKINKSPQELQQDSISKSVQILMNTKRDIASLMGEYPEINSLHLTVDHQLDVMINRLSFHSGDHQTVVQNPKEAFPPVTDFMGEKINTPKDVTKEDLQPGQNDRQLYVGKVENLYAQLETMDPFTVLNSYTNPDDQLVLRGVAKMAGVEDFDTREINVPFIEDVQASMKNKAAADMEQNKIDEQLRLDQEQKMKQDGKGGNK